MPTDHGPRSKLIRAGLCLGLLKEEPKEDMVGGVLGSFKATLDQAGHFANDVLAYGKLVHSCLSAVLSNIDDMR